MPDQMQYKIKTATEQEVLFHLEDCSASFIPPLSERINIAEYAKKIYENSMTFEAWEAGVLAGLIAAYFNNTRDRIGFITNVSVVKAFTGLGVASKLLAMCIEHARNNDFLKLKLEVNKNNTPAIRFYSKFGFENQTVKNDVLLMEKNI
jgi:ribosomal protein S18 acetylase RimI-like enzyme